MSLQLYMSSEKRLCLGSNVGRPANSLVSAVQQSEPTAILQQIHGTSLTNHFLLLSSDVTNRQHRPACCRLFNYKNFYTTGL